MEEKDKTAVTNIIQKFSPTTNDTYEHVILLSVEDARVIASLHHNDVDV